jgi:pyridoxamine 5'-phosphate oxidase
MLDLSAMRQNYKQESLTEHDVSIDPFIQFRNWFTEAIDGQIMEPNAMTLATATSSGRPSARIVLLKSFDHQGFVFFTNYESHKANQLAENPHAALLFCWLELERQIRLEGRVEKIDAAESLEYFQSRPKESQIGAWASPQSRIIPDRAFIEQKVQALQNQHLEDKKLPLPPFWGGYRLIPDRFEFWQGRESRLHDRIVYQQESGKQEWQIVRLGP